MRMVSPVGVQQPSDFSDIARPTVTKAHTGHKGKLPELSNLRGEARRRRRERLISNADLVRPNPDVPIGWPSDGMRPPWDPLKEDDHPSS